MYAFIETIISKFGGRVAGTEAEMKAQEFVRNTLEPYCDEVEWHEFQSALKAKFHSLKGFCIVYVVGIIFFAWNPFIAALISLVNAVLFIGHFLVYRDWLDFLYKKYTSHNVIGKIEPVEEHRSTLIISGHIDSVVEFQWWYKLKQLGGILTTVSGFLIVTQGIVYLLAVIFLQVIGEIPSAFTWLWWSHIVLSPILVTFFFMHGTERVDGALDNLTGVALAVEMAKVFSGDNRLKHTRLKVISFGSEETGLRGARNYVESHEGELREEKASLVNIDTIKDRENLSIVTGEINPMITYPKYMVDKLEKSFVDTQIPYKKVKLPIGATDGAAFAMRNLPAVSIIGLTTKGFDPTYHTRLDKLENLDPSGLEAMKEVLIRFIGEWDQTH